LNHMLTPARLFFILALCIITIGRHYFLYSYAVFFIVVIEFLQSRPLYRNLKGHKTYTSIFILYLLFIVINRSRQFQFNDGIERMINIVEHGSFALVICLLTTCYFNVYMPKWPKARTIIIVVLIFNLIGYTNELFQNYVNGRPPFQLELDAVSDLRVNALGSLVFVCFMLFGTGTRNWPEQSGSR